MSKDSGAKGALERAARRAERVALMDVSGGANSNEHEDAGAEKKRPRTGQLILCWGLSTVMWARQ